MSTNTNPDSIIFTGTKLVHNALFYITKYACNKKKTIVTTSNDAICRNYNIQSRNYIQNDKKSLNDAMH